MRHLILLSLLVLLSPIHAPTAKPQDESPVLVTEYKWTRSKQVVEKLQDPANPGSAPAMIPQNKNFERNVRTNNPTGARDPNEDTIDGRHAALEKAVEESRTNKGKPVEGYAYRVKVKNSSAKAIDILFWEYQFIDATKPDTIARRQFLCGVNMKPGKDKEIQAFSIAGPGEVVTVQGLENKTANSPNEKVVINRIEYSDGTMWQRKDWKFAEIRLTYQRALATPWGTEMCRPL